MSDGSTSSELLLALERVRARVEERTRSGDYPLAIDEQLQQRFGELVGRTHDDHGITAALAGVLRQPIFDRARIESTSRLPGGSALHDAVGKIVSRQVLGTLQQLQDYRAHLEVLLTALADAYVELAAERNKHWRTVNERLAEVEELSVRYRSLERRLDALEGHADRVQPSA